MTDASARLRTALADRYAIDGAIGAGGMATVYLAQDLKHKRKVAIKVLRQDIAQAIGAERFLREIEVTAKLQHPHILPLHDSGEADEYLYYVMPYVDSASLRGVMHGTRHLELAYIVKIATEVAGALDYAHRQGVLHRDIKPENILLSEGHAVVADFGIAKAITDAGGGNLTKTGWALGTPGYMSPEQATGNPNLDARNDVFGLACVVYEMVTGETPPMWPTDEDVRVGRFLDAPADHRAALDRLPVTVEQALTKATAMRPDQRFASPGDFARALRAQPKGGSYDTAEVREIVERAAASEVQHPTDANALSLGQVQRIGAEAGIRPERIRNAAAALGQITEHHGSGSLLFGPSEKIDIESLVGREVTETEYEEILSEIRGTMGEVGRLNQTLGKSLSWNSLTFQNTVEGGGRLIHVMVKPGGGRTQIRITEGGGQQPVYFAVGIGVGSVVGMMLAALTGNKELTLLFAGAGGGVAAVAARVLYGRLIAHRRRVADGLMRRLRALVDRSPTPERLIED